MVDQQFIEGSNDWLDEINKALKLASALIVCISAEALESRYVKMEYRYAFNNGKPIYPLICREAELPAELQILQYYAYTELDKLVTTLKHKSSIATRNSAKRLSEYLLLSRRGVSSGCFKTPLRCREVIKLDQLH